MYRFFVEPNQIGEESIVIVGKDVNHIKNVLRMKIGETILISDGSDKEYICSVEKIADDEITAKIEDINGETRELPIKVTLFQALPKGDKMETIIQKMVELGAYQIVPMSTKRCVVKLDAKKAANKVKRWNAIAESAAKQSKRGIIPEVAEVHTFKEAVEKAKELDIPIKKWSLLQKGETVEADGRVFTPDMVMGPPRKGLKVTYATDTRPVANIAKAAKDADLFVCEGMYGEPDKEEKAKEHKHMTFVEAANIAKEANPKEMWLTHYSPSLVKPWLYLDTVTDIFPNAKTGKDGMSVDLMFED